MRCNTPTDIQPAGAVVSLPRKAHVQREVFSIPVRVFVRGCFAKGFSRNRPCPHREVSVLLDDHAGRAQMVAFDGVQRVGAAVVIQHHHGVVFQPDDLLDGVVFGFMKSPTQRCQLYRATGNVTTVQKIGQCYSIQNRAIIFFIYQKILASVRSHFVSAQKCKKTIDISNINAAGFHFRIIDLHANGVAISFMIKFCHLGWNKKRHQCAILNFKGQFLGFIEIIEIFYFKKLIKILC